MRVKYSFIFLMFAILFALLIPQVVAHDFLSGDLSGCLCWSFDPASLADYGCVREGCAELIVGFRDDVPQAFVAVDGIAAKYSGAIVDKLSFGNRIVAVTVRIPVEEASSFVFDVYGSGLARYVEPNARAKPLWVPNDPLWSYQWNLQKIGADWAWNITLGDPAIKVGLIDTGVNHTHPDLLNVIDLDLSWNYESESSDIMDRDGHGTAMAGVLAATINNGEGLAGLAQVKIIVGSAPNFTVADVAQAIYGLTRKGAKIISMSWGFPEHSPTLYNATRYAYENGVLLVAAAGNANTDKPMYPAAYSEVVAVSATDMHDNRAVWWTPRYVGEPVPDPLPASNYGSWIELAAPGTNIPTTNRTGGYDLVNGTSPAAPHVAGLAALVWSAYPNLTRDELRLHLRYTADDLGTAGFDTSYGYGRINARKALEHVPVQHDLYVTLHVPQELELGQSALLEATVHNMGLNNEVNVQLSILINGTVAASTTMANLPTKTSITLSYLWTPAVKGTYNITAYAQPVPSEDPTNNACTKLVNVTPPTPGGGGGDVLLMRAKTLIVNCKNYSQGG